MHVHDAHRCRTEGHDVTVLEAFQRKATPSKPTPIVPTTWPSASMP
jgi:hypothetical protein